MKIYNIDKTIELNENEIDREKGYLKPDKLVIAHHEATPEIKGKSAEEVAAELKAEGKPIIEIGGKPYIVDRAYDDNHKEIAITADLDLKKIKNKSVTAIKSTPDVPAKEAYDDYEDIQVYVPYTEEELKERTISKLKARRERECFTYVNRGAVWYDGLTAEQRTELDVWYRAWLDVTETLTPPDKPEWLK